VNNKEEKKEFRAQEESKKISSYEDKIELSYDEEINSVGGASYYEQRWESTIINVNAPRLSRIKSGGEIKLGVSFSFWANQWYNCSLTRNYKCRWIFFSNCAWK